VGRGETNAKSVAVRDERRGVNIVTCFVTDSDVTETKMLYARERPEWSELSRQMFSMASEVTEYSPVAEIFKEFSWKVPERAKLFVQINHSPDLEQLMRVILDSEVKDSELEER
jgi:hypothetical protein